MTPHSFITKCGGYKEVAAKVGRHPRAVWRWLDNGIPSRAWSAVAAIAREKGMQVTLDEIAAMRPAPRQKMRRGRRKAVPA